MNYSAIELEAEVEETTLIAIHNRLRNKNFSRNLPFLILSEKLPQGQAYREYADGHIELQEIYATGPDLKSRHIRTLTLTEAEIVRKENGLL